MTFCTLENVDIEASVKPSNVIAGFQCLKRGAVTAFPKIGIRRIFENS
ncbi:MAG: hypothetical protein QXT53_04965 [Ignisphaera sp.]